MDKMPIGREKPRHFTGDRLVIASHNAGKLREIADLVAPFGIEAVSAAALGLPEPEETEVTFAGNAQLKALAAARASGVPALADDSGLVVDALDGAPGVYSARWAGPNKDFNAAMDRVLEAIGKDKPRHAHFVCVLALAYPDGHCDLFEGRIDGAIAQERRGARGFGYDPIFLPAGGSQTFGEITPAEKLAMNHRARAFRKLIDAAFRR